MSEDKDTEGEGFVIKDRRSSQISEDQAQAEEEHILGESEAPKDIPQDSASEDSGAQDFQIDFSTFILSLTSSAFYHLGDMPDPTTGKTEENLPAVQQTIDMLSMLKQKTTGNLTEDEAKLLEQLIYELQMKYVEKTKK